MLVEHHAVIPDEVEHRIVAMKHADPKPFVWHTPAADIIEKVQRGRSALHQIKSTPDH